MSSPLAIATAENLARAAQLLTRPLAPAHTLEGLHARLLRLYVRIAMLKPTPTDALHLSGQLAHLELTVDRLHNWRRMEPPSLKRPPAWRRRRARKAAGAPSTPPT